MTEFFSFKRGIILITLSQQMDDLRYQIPHLGVIPAVSPYRLDLVLSF